MLTLNPVYDNGLLTSRGVINVAKNSWGKTLEVEVWTNPARFLWVNARTTSPLPAVGQDIAF